MLQVEQPSKVGTRGGRLRLGVCRDSIRKDAVCEATVNRPIPLLGVNRNGHPRGSKDP